jgi:2'-deoxynucleoside 5'-phosphate N-hydrolase
MKVYFAGAIRGGRADQPFYEELIEYTASRGVQVLCEHFDTQNSASLTDKEIHDRDMAWIEESSAIVAEVSIPSLGVGYEIGRGHGIYLPVLALYWKRPNKELSAMISGAPHTEIVRYNRRTQAGRQLAKTAIRQFLHEVEYGNPFKHRLD